MPQSKKRKTSHHVQHDFIPHKKKRKSAVPVAMVVCTLLALGIAWFAAGRSIPILIVGAIAGALIGLIAGKQMDKTFSK